MITYIDILKNLILTEKTSSMSIGKKYVFSVDYRSNKNIIKKAINEAFPEVKIEKINILNVKPKTKRRGKYIGKTSKVKKAIVTLTKDSEGIDVFPSTN